jgi:two-component system CheB/CheR fusion protein
MGDIERLLSLEAENLRLQVALDATETRNQSLLRDLKLRVSNILMIVRSVARRTAQASENAEECAMHLDGRLGAIIRAQSMILRDSGFGVGVDDLLAEELLTHIAHEGDQVSLLGPPVRLHAKVAAGIMLAVHELSVNAMKFGALSQPNGRLTIRWQVKSGSRTSGNSTEFQLEWQETGVPFSGVPLRRGFGTELIERTLPYDLGATCSLDFLAEGLTCTITLPITDDVVAL